MQDLVNEAAGDRLRTWYAIATYESIITEDYFEAVRKSFPSPDPYKIENQLLDADNCILSSDRLHSAKILLVDTTFDREAFKQRVKAARREAQRLAAIAAIGMQLYRTEKRLLPEEIRAQLRELPWETIEDLSIEVFWMETFGELQAKIDEVCP